jgi:hypothetical protein
MYSLSVSTSSPAPKEKFCVRQWLKPDDVSIYIIGSSTKYFVSRQ